MPPGPGPCDLGKTTAWNVPLRHLWACHHTVSLQNLALSFVLTKHSETAGLLHTRERCIIRWSDCLKGARSQSIKWSVPRTRLRHTASHLQQRVAALHALLPTRCQMAMESWVWAGEQALLMHSWSMDQDDGGAASGKLTRLFWYSMIQIDQSSRPQGCWPRLKVAWNGLYRFRDMATGYYAFS